MLSKFILLVNRYWLALTLLILSAITVLSLTPLDSMPSAPGSDKTHHFIAYAALMFPTALRKPPFYLLIGVFFILFSGTIELIQPFVNRYGEWLDLAANTGGIICGLALAFLVHFLFPKVSPND